MTKFKIGEKVNIDGDTSIQAYIIGIMVYSDYEQYKVSWLHNGTYQEAWLDEFRLTRIPT